MDEKDCIAKAAVIAVRLIPIALGLYAAMIGACYIIGKLKGVL